MLVVSLVVSNKAELKNAIDDAQSDKSTVIALDRDITLTSLVNTSNHSDGYVLLVIPPNKDITLTSNKTNGYYKLASAVHGTSQFIAVEYNASTIIATYNDIDACLLFRSL
jgi:hypothetical protein